MKLVLITSSFPAEAEDSAAAAGLFVRDFAQLLARQGHEVHVITQRKRKTTTIVPDGIKVHDFPWPLGDMPLAKLSWKNPLHLWAAYRWFHGCRKALQELDHIDHVLAFWAVPAGWAALKSGHPFSTWCLGSDIWKAGRSPLLRNQVSLVLKRSEHCYADGMELAKEAENLSRREVTFLPSSRLLPTLTKSEEKSPSQENHFLFIGRYDLVKGCDLLLEAMARYKVAGGSRTLKMYGTGPLEEELKTRTEAHDLLNSVSVLGMADRETVVRELKACDALIIPSRQESIPLVFSDALQCQVPVIVSDVGDMGGLVKEHQAGLVVKREDISSLTQALLDFTLRFDDGVTKLSQNFRLEHSVDLFLADLKKGRRS